MEYIIYCILGVLLLFFIILFLKQQKQNKYLLEENRKIEENKLEELNQRYNKRKEFLEEDYNKKQEYLQDQYKKRENQLYQDFYQAQQNYNKITENLDQNFKRYKESQYKLIQEDLEEYSKNEKFKKQIEIEKNTQELYEQYIKKQKLLEEEFQSKKAEIESEIEETYDDAAEAALEYCDILETLDDFRRRREVVNSQVLREKQIQEEKDYYRICLSQNDIEDLQIIKDIEHKFNNKEVLHRAAFDCYVRRPLSEMQKRVLGNKKPSGIYIITYIPTGEIYIGRSTDIANRWAEHVKSAFNLGTIAHSSLHTKMEEKGIQNFTFQILEEVPKEKLNEREKYWINLYGATALLNQKQGG